MFQAAQLSERISVTDHLILAAPSLVLFDLETSGQELPQRVEETACGRDLTRSMSVDRVFRLEQLTLDSAASNFALLLKRATSLRHLRIRSHSHWFCFVAEFWPLLVRLYSLHDSSVKSYTDRECLSPFVQACKQLRSAVRDVWLRKGAPLTLQDVKSLATDPRMAAAEMFLLDDQVASGVAIAWNEDEDKGPSRGIRWQSLEDLEVDSTRLKWLNLHYIDVGKLEDDLFDDEDNSPKFPPLVPRDFLETYDLDG